VKLVRRAGRCPARFCRSVSRGSLVGGPAAAAGVRVRALAFGTARCRAYRVLVPSKLIRVGGTGSLARWLPARWQAGPPCGSPARPMWSLGDGSRFVWQTAVGGGQSCQPHGVGAGSPAVRWGRCGGPVGSGVPTCCTGRRRLSGRCRGGGQVGPQLPPPGRSGLVSRDPAQQVRGWHRCRTRRCRVAGRAWSMCRWAACRASMSGSRAVSASRSVHRCAMTWRPSPVTSRV
jgi:hypothetical protein